ncbi:MAG: CDP-alcohol phosphatidyltransferase family protein [Anaerolineae bacterium]
MISEWVREQTRDLVVPIARLISRIGVSPNTLTVVGLLGMVGVGAVLAAGQSRLGAALLLLVAALDFLDGALARLRGRATPFGAFLDSSLDRFAEVAIFFGLLYYYIRQGASTEVLLVYLTITGSLLVSYARARASAAGVECKVGLMARPERIVLLALGLFLDQMYLTLWVLTVLTNLTAIHRVIYVWRVMKG